jgi:hypothetical protein
MHPLSIAYPLLSYGLPFVVTWQFAPIAGSAPQAQAQQIKYLIQYLPAISTEKQRDAINFTAEMLGRSPARQSVFLLGNPPARDDWQQFLFI